LNVTMLLCDAAEVVNGKLYILGGAWTHVLTPNQPINMALAIVVHIPWDQANKRHTLEVSLLTEDGPPVLSDDKPVKVQGVVEVGRPAGAKPGSELNAAAALRFDGIALAPGGYVWELSLNGEPGSRTPFWVQGVAH
jgi:hypothetical protein